MEQQSQLEQEKLKTEKRGTAKKTKILIGITLLFFLLLLSFVAINFLKKENAPASEELQALTLIQKETPLPKPKVERLSVIYTKEDKMNLEISFLEETWLQVYADGELRIDGLKNPDQTITVEARDEFFIHLGNAGGFTYKINDKKGKPLGASGASIRNLKITLANYKKFIEES